MTGCCTGTGSMRVDLSFSGVFRVRVFISPPSGGVLFRLYISTGPQDVSDSHAWMDEGQGAKRHWGPRVFFRQEVLKEESRGNFGDVTEGCESQDNSHCFQPVQELL